ncbi:DUF4145 domain-containing protein [Nocardia elegans]|uniref:DUF4145 domain-containing protein n=1 Tax=Nocardia elegans TaxID=300029 RepID=A0ABW6TKL9_9NOCA
MRDSVKQLAYYFAGDRWPVLECPVCLEGTLVLKKDSLETFDSRASIREYESSGDQMMLSGIFCGHLVCTSSRCGDCVAVVGDYGWDPEEAGYGLEDVYRVRALHPPVRVIDSPESTPESVRATLKRAAGVAWQDPSTGISLLRQSVERLLDEQGIDPLTASGGFRSLKFRIEEYKKKNAEVAELLEALRFAGNSGAHEDELTIEEFLKTAQIIELALKMLYQKESMAAREHAKRIVEACKYVP